MLDGDRLVLENRCIRREFDWNGGHLVSRSLIDRRTGRVWTLAADKPDCALPDQSDEPADGTLEVTDRPATAAEPGHLQVDCTVRLADLWIRRRFRIYPDCPAIACDFYLRGRAAGQWTLADVDAAGLTNIEDRQAAREGRVRATVMERLATGDRHLKLTAVQFFDVTDRRNNLVAARTILPYRQETRLTGNLLLISNVLEADRGLFVLKEAPCSDVQLAHPGCDFVAITGEVRVVGLGVTPADVLADEWTRCYGVVTGVAAGDEYSLLTALKQYQANLRVAQPGRDHSIMLNTWGDRSATDKIGEAFCIAELDAGSRLGVTHFQIDDGWQMGEAYTPPGGALRPQVAGRSDPGYDSRQFWQINPERFPDGFAPVAEHARKVGIELCLWTAPGTVDSYARWRDDADMMIEVHRRYGIRTFKIDGVQIPDKQADRNFRAMLDRVMAATDGEAVFNLDATAGRRFGYHYLTHYGNIFLENRYTDWGNYYPHWTLRNLWTLSRYVPTQGLQIEFLNRWRNAGKYPANDPLAPGRVPFDYCFAITMMAQPLAWFEATGLPAEAFEIAGLIHTYREHQERMHAGMVFPIGAEPDGTRWTGFQSVRDDGGYILVLREYNQQETAQLGLWGLAGRRIRCKMVAGSGGDFIGSMQVPDDGRVEFRVAGPHGFALYEYLLV